jgi:hypothetical protein
MTSTPAPTLDNAEVLYWAWAGERPFGVLPDIDGADDSAVFGFAICRYAQSGEMYRFSCDQSWNVVQDSPCGPVDDPYRVPLPLQYDTRGIVWMSYHPSGSTALTRPTSRVGDWISAALQHLGGRG